jgi:hypothetical protein
VTLTYNLLLQGDAATVDPPPAQVDPVAAWLLGHFETAAAPARRTAGAAAHEPARRLVYLLDHEYTARGLSWSRLKGPDAMRAATLQAAAVQAGCEVVLALADIHETWDCMEQEESPWYGGSEPRRWDDWDDELDEDDPRAGGQSLGDQDRYQLEDLIDWDVTLVCWIDAPDGEPKPVSLSIDPSDVCASVPSVELPPYASEYEGYMGNYGNTMDRWYHRAALVVWPQHQAFAARAEASPLWALGTLSARLGAGGAAEAQELTATLAPFWPRVARGETARGFFGKALRIARDLDEPDSAAMLVTPLRVEMLGRREAPALAALAGRYGEGWARELLALGARLPERAGSHGVGLLAARAVRGAPAVGRSGCFGCQPAHPRVLGLAEGVGRTGTCGGAPEPPGGGAEPTRAADRRCPPERGAHCSPRADGGGASLPLPGQRRPDRLPDGGAAVGPRARAVRELGGDRTGRGLLPPPPEREAGAPPTC